MIVAGAVLRASSAGTNHQPTRRGELTRNGRPHDGRVFEGVAWQRLVAGVLLAASCLLATASIASAETRTLKLYYLHTREKAEITYKKDGKYLASGLKQLNYFLRDWRRNEPTKMDPRLFDAVWEVYRAVGGRDYIHVVSGYRSPATNSMLRKRGRGVAEKSQHMQGKAMDFFIPGVKLRDIRYAGLRLGAGGVGCYPTSGSPFVHIDVGNVRHWPKMSRTELAAVFPHGKTMHVPSDGKPLPGYELALASYQKRKGAGVSIASAETTKRSGGFFSRLFGGGADEEEESGTSFAEAAPSRASKTVATARAPAAPLPGVTEAEAPAPAEPAQAAEPEVKPAETAETIIAALPLRDVPRPMFAPRPSVDVGPAAAETELAQGESLVETPELQAVAAVDNVPIPMARPAYKAPATQLAEAAGPSVATAMAARSSATKGELAIESIIAADSTARTVNGIPIPMARPQHPVVVAALAPTGESMTDETGAAKSGRAVLAGTKPASPRDALRGIEADPVAAVNAGPTTTQKSSKPRAVDSRPDPKPVSKPVQTAMVNRAMSVERSLSAKPDGKSFAVRSLRSAPAEVYTAGFQQNAAPNPQRFSGKAVTFMPVAKFEAN